MNHTVHSPTHTTTVPSERPLALAAAAQRLRRRPGRPRKEPLNPNGSEVPSTALRTRVPNSGVANPGPPPRPASGAAIPRPRDHTVTVSDRRKSQAPQPGGIAFGSVMVPTSGPVRRLGGLGTAALPRLLPLPVAAWYLGISRFSLRDVVKSGGLRPVPLPLPPDRRGRRRDGQLRKLLFDVRDLDELIELWKDKQRSASASRRA
jgi:hypothetical protein